MVYVIHHYTKKNIYRVCDQMTLALLDATNSHKVNSSFASSFVNHAVVASSNIFIQDKVLHHSYAHKHSLRLI